MNLYAYTARLVTWPNQFDEPTYLGDCRNVECILDYEVRFVTAAGNTHTSRVP